MRTNTIYNENCLDTLRRMPDNYLSAIVTDPPYGLSFMGKSWDYDVPSVDIWRECLRVLKPGGHLLAFAGTRTQHRMAVNIEDAGFKIRDMIAWVYGSGFPKSLNVGKVMDKYIKTGNASWNGTGDSSNGVLGYSKMQHNQGYRPKDYSNAHQNKEDITEEAAKQWEGWGTALKPSLEPITVARKPFKGSVAQNVLEYGTGAINIDGCRVGTEMIQGGRSGRTKGSTFNASIGQTVEPHQGRFPANLIHDGSDEVTGLFPETKGEIGRVGRSDSGNYNATSYKVGVVTENGLKDSGSAARFFYCAKASKEDRGDHNTHPTVKPIKLMRYLIKLVTPPNGIIYDPFMGSGTTAIAAHQESVEWIGSEMSPEYHQIATERIKKATAQLKLF